MDINGGRLSFDAWIKDTDFNRQLAAMEQRIIGMSETTVKETKKIDRQMSIFAASIAGYFTQQSISRFVNDLINVRSEFQQLDITFTTMLKSKDRADRLMKELVEFAGTTPFGLKDAANAAKQLLAYGSNAEEVTEELRMLGDVAAGTSQPIGELTYLFGTARTQGRAYLMDIRQFAGRGIPIYEELAKVLGTTVDQVNDFVSSGKVGFEEIQQAFRNMTAEGSMFGGLMEAQSKTFQGQIERVRDAWDEMLNTIGASNEGVINMTIEGIGTIIENYDKLLNVLAGTVAVYGSYRAALIATAAIQQVVAARTVGMTTVEMLHLGAITAKTAAMRVLNAVMAASPVIAMTAAISGLVAVIYSLTQVTNATAAARERLNEAIEAGGKSADDERRNVEQLIAVLRSQTATVEQKEAAYKKLIDQTGDILTSYSQEEIATGKAARALDQYIDKIREAASARKAFDEFNSLAEQMDDLNRAGIDAVGTWTRLGRSIKNTFTPTSQGVGFGEWIDVLFKGDSMAELIVSQEKGVLEKSMDELKKTYGDKWEEIITGVKPDDKKGPIITIAQQIDSLNEKISDTEEKIKGLLLPGAEYDKTKIDEAQASLKKLREERDLLMGKTKEGEKANKDLERWGEKRLDILQKIADKEASILAKGMTENERELQEARNHYAELRRVIEEHNAKAPASARIGSGVLDRINEIENRETGDIQYRQETDKLKTSLDERLNIFKKYQDARLEIGNAAARQMYSSEELFTEDYRSLLTSQINALQGMEMEMGLTGVQRERLKELLELLKSYDRDERDIANERVKYLLTTYQSYEQKREAIIVKANKDIADLEKKGEKDRANVAKQERDKMLLELYQSEIEADERFQSMQRTFEIAGSAMAVRALKHGKGVVDGIIAGLDIKDEALKAKLEEMFGDWFNQAIESAEQENFSNLTGLVDGFGQLVESAMQFDGTMSGALKTIGSMVSQVGQLAQTLGKTFQDVGGGLSKAGGYGAIIGAVISVIGGVMEATEKAAERARQKYNADIDYSSDFQLKQLEAVTKALERQTQLIQEAYGVDRVQRWADIIKGANESFTDTLKEFEGDRVNIDKDRNQIFDIYRGRAALVKFQLTGNRDYDQLIELINKGADLPVALGANTPGKDAALIRRLMELLNSGQLIPIEFGFSSVGEMKAEDVERLYKLIDEDKLDEATSRLAQNLITQFELTKNALNEMRAELTGTTFGGVTDEIVSMFERGTIAAEDFADNFEKIMHRAILQSLKRNVLETQLQGWYEEFAKAVESDNPDGTEGLSAGEVDKLQQQYNDILEKAKTEFENLKAVAGVSFASDSPTDTGLRGGIERMTEQTATELVGLYRATYDLNRNQLDAIGVGNNFMAAQVQIMRDKLAVLAQIQTNTSQTANNTSRLEAIEAGINQMVKNTKQGSNSYERPWG